MKEIVIKKDQYRSRYKANREEYTILEVRWSDFSEFEKGEIYREADILYKRASKIGANTGLPCNLEKNILTLFVA